MVDLGRELPRVLLVDDEPLLLRALARMLRNAPLRVVSANTAEEALELLEAMSYAVVVSDLSLPGMDGLELLGLVRERWPAAGRLLLTGHGPELERIGVPARHGVRVLCKPCAPEAFCEAVQRAASGHSP